MNEGCRQKSLAPALQRVLAFLDPRHFISCGQDAFYDGLPFLLHTYMYIMGGWRFRKVREKSFCLKTHTRHPRHDRLEIRNNVERRLKDAASEKKVYEKMGKKNKMDRSVSERKFNNLTDLLRREHR